MKVNRLLVCVIAGMMPLLASCAHYYKVNDPAGGKEYYTQKIDSSRSGSIKIKDASTGAVVTLQSSEVKEISEDEYEAGINKAKVAPAGMSAPAGAPAPTGKPAPAAPPAPPAPAGTTGTTGTTAPTGTPAP